MISRVLLFYQTLNDAIIELRFFFLILVSIDCSLVPCINFHFLYYDSCIPFKSVSITHCIQLDFFFPTMASIAIRFVLNWILHHWYQVSSNRWTMNHGLISDFFSGKIFLFSRSTYVIQKKRRKKRLFMAHLIIK